MAIDLLPTVLPIPWWWAGLLVTALVIQRVLPRTISGVDRLIERSLNRRKRRK